LTAIEAFDTLLKKRQEKADKEFKKTTTAARIDVNKKKNALKRKGFKLAKIRENVDVMLVNSR
jgi:hypothetical protein